MTSKEEFATLLNSRQEQQVEAGGVRARAAEQPPVPQSRSRRPPKFGEQAPLLPPTSQTVSQPIATTDWPVGAPHLDPAHPFNKSPSAGGLPRSNRPPRGAGNPPVPPPSPPPQSSVVSPFYLGSPQGSSVGGRHHGHRRVKSDIPKEVYGSGGGGGSVAGGSMGRLITKSDLMKNLPDPRWGGAPPTHTRNRSRTGSDGPLHLSEHGGVSTVGGYGATDPGHPLLQSIGNTELAPGGRHRRTGSDASVVSVTTDMAKSSLFKGVTDTGRIQLQLPKDSFRILMDRQLEAGYVYKRKLVDNEDEFFVEFHTVDEVYPLNAVENQKRLPPDLYVMAVDSTIYKRMFDEVIASRAMPCGSYYCGHHADVRHPDITIAALAVSVVFFVLLVGCIVYGAE
ncbi:hypothetical protein ACHAW5_010775 [Stephanodiscus triporus]|uniref:Uncharacterized protein n=1 Tax=Stephanodiscus triporus TaxID=2934178 RepID=A0ABD3PXT1_9STRA